jgi:hypothetical protein
VLSRLGVSVIIGVAGAPTKIKRGRSSSSRAACGVRRSAARFRTDVPDRRLVHGQEDQHRDLIRVMLDKINTRST